MNNFVTKINVKNVEIETRNLEYSQEYSWTDDFGFHQYVCENKMPTIKTEICNFSYNNTLIGRVYSWTDNLGFHQYYANNV